MTLKMTHFLQSSTWELGYSRNCSIGTNDCLLLGARDSSFGKNNGRLLKENQMMTQIIVQSMILNLNMKWLN